MFMNLKARIVHTSEVFSKIQIAVIIAVLIRMFSVCIAENANALSTYDPRKVANARQGCVGNTCCSTPYETVYQQRPLWSFAKSNYICCVPRATRNKENCCPYPLIPSREPNMDPEFGPFCCDPETGHCCSKLKISLNMQPADYVFSEPTGGECCATYDTSLFIKCCPRPLLMVGKTVNSLGPKAPNNLCCSSPKLCYSVNLHYDYVPSPRLCSPREFCCPYPYSPIINYANKKIDEIPQYDPKYDSQCTSPAGKICTLPQVPWYKSCIDQQFATEISLQDSPLYDIILPEFSNHDPSAAVASSNPQCLKNYVFRRTYGNPFVNPNSHSVAVDWFVTSPYVQRSKLLNETYAREQIWIWPDVIIPFIFPITIAAISIATVLPALVLGAIGWALVFNFRFLWVKRVRMAIRRIYVCIEKRRRIIQDNYLPPEDQRKLHARERYQLPKALQDSDRSEDDEPEDLKRTHIDVVESHWTAEEIDVLGFDPDNIPVDWIYGDLLGNPSALRKEVQKYNTTGKASGRPLLSEDDEILKQLHFEEWLHFLCKGKTGTQDGGTTQQGTLERRRSIKRYKTRKKIAKRVRVRIKIKSSDTISESPSTARVSKRRKKKKHKSKSKKKSSRRKGTT